MKTFGKFAEAAIAKSFRKAVALESAVLQDKDPEDLHDMRVAMRRLQTALQVFEPALELPTPLSRKRVRQLAHRLGDVRDLDVQMIALQDHYRPQLPKSEQKQLDQLIKHLKRDRTHAFAALQDTLKSDRYQEFEQTGQHWQKQAAHKPLAELPVLAVVPDILLSLIAQLLLHPGWLVELPAAEQNGQSNAKSVEPSMITLHDLRKQIKQVRYQSELFADFYPDAFQAQIKEFQMIQGILGEFQDSFVLQGLLSKQVKGHLAKTMPTLDHILQTERQQRWEQWQPLQQQYREPGFRNQLRQLVIPPTATATSKSKDQQSQARTQSQAEPEVAAAKA